MLSIGDTLCWLGRRGPFLLPFSLLIGLLSPGVAPHAPWLLPISAFLMFLGSLQSAALTEDPRDGRPERLFATALLFVLLGPPLLAALVTAYTAFDPDLDLGLRLAALAPPAGSSAAIAAMFGLRTRLALGLQISLTLAAPIILPLALLGLGVDLERFGLTPFIRLLAIIAAAATVASPPICRVLRTCRIVPEPIAASGLAMIGLSVGGVTIGSGLGSLTLPEHTLTSLFALALAIHVASLLLAVLIFARRGLPVALTIGLATSNRHVTLVWASVGAVLPLTTQSYLAVCIAPTLLLPLVLKASLGARRMLAERHFYLRNREL